jgi:hypothetical protein
MILLVVCVVAVVVDLVPGLPARLGLRRQVDDAWVYQYRGWAYGLGFGVQLGTGVLTVVSSAQILVALIAAALLPSLAAAGLVGALIGLLRGLPTVLTRRVTSVERLMSLGRRVEAARPLGHRVVIGGGCVLAAFLAVVVIS